MSALDDPRLSKQRDSAITLISALDEVEDVQELLVNLAAQLDDTMEPLAALLQTIHRAGLALKDAGQEDATVPMSTQLLAAVSNRIGGLGLICAAVEARMVTMIREAEAEAEAAK